MPATYPEITFPEGDLLATATRTVLAKLREPFPVEDVKQRPGGGGKLDYVAIETVLARLLDVAPDFSWEGKLEAFTDGIAVVSGQLTIGDKTAFGVGAMKNPDADMAVKSANSEAIKNAAKNGFGVSLELWSAEYRTSLDKRRKLAQGSAASLKQDVYSLAVERLGKAKPTAAEIGQLFGVKPGDLSDAETLRAILQKELSE